MYRMYGSRTMQDAIVEGKTGLSHISSSFKEHVILFDGKELEIWLKSGFSAVGYSKSDRLLVTC
jgi:hypothetical protein